jgi:Uncharacterized protein conserved in bacteria
MWKSSRRRKPRSSRAWPPIGSCGCWRSGFCSGDVRLLAERFLQRGDGIADIRLGYHGQMYESDTQVLAPKWRIVLDNGDIYYVHAVNGEVERP